MAEGDFIVIQPEPTPCGFGPTAPPPLSHLILLSTAQCTDNHQASMASRHIK